MTKQLSKEAWVVRYRTNYPDSKIEMIGQYVNSYSKTKFKCHKEHEWESTPCRVGLGGGCPRCSGKYRYKNTQEWMQAYKEKYTTSKIEMIGEYLNKRTKTKFKCHKGHVWETAPCHIMCGGNCPHCSRNYNYKNKEEWMQSYRSIYLDSVIEMIGDYINGRTKTLFRCDQGHEWPAAPYDLVTGAGCSHCSRNYNYKNPIFTS